MGVFIFGEFGRNLASLSRLFTASADRSFKFLKRSQLFIRTHNETLSVTAMRVNNPDCSPVAIHGRDAAPTSTGLLEVISD